MTYKPTKDWGTILLQMALDAHQDGDLVTAERFVASQWNSRWLYA
jgi:hypothetical protein